MKIFPFSLTKTPFEVHHETDNYYYSYEIVDKEIVEFKFPKNKCVPACKDCSKPTKWERGFEPIWYWFCEACNMNNILKDRNKEDWKTKDWVKNDFYSREHDMCDTCKYFMFHSFFRCPICGEKATRRKLTLKEMAKQFPDCKQGC